MFTIETRKMTWLNVIMIDYVLFRKFSFSSNVSLSILERVKKNKT